MNGNFNGQILVEKLAKLNCSQQSIETLSHWCIFHRKNARQVVETWNRQFLLSPEVKKVSFLYLANDILQNSRRKGAEFVVEFWKVLPHALSHVIENGDGCGKRAAMRLVNIWEERKVFGSRGHILKEELLGRKQENHSLGGINPGEKISACNALEKLISSYKHVYDGHKDEDALLNKCQATITTVVKAKEEISNDNNSGNRSETIKDLHRQHGTLQECIDQLKAAESARAALVSNLRETLRDEEMKLGRVRSKLQAAESCLELKEDIYKRLGNHYNEQGQIEAASAPEIEQNPPESQIIDGGKPKSEPVIYSAQLPDPDIPPLSEDNLKTTAAAVAAKLAASSSSAEVLSYVLSSFASENGTLSAREDHTSDGSKRAKLENGLSSSQFNHGQIAPPPFPHPYPVAGSFQSPPQPESYPTVALQPLQVPQSLPPLQPPLLPTHTMITSVGSSAGVSYGCGPAPVPCPTSGPDYSSGGMPVHTGPPNGHQNASVSENVGFLSQPSLPSMSRQQ